MNDIEEVLKDMRELNADITNIKGEIYKQYERLQTARYGLSKLETKIEELKEVER